MKSQYQDMISQIYTHFNARNIDAALSHMHPDVHWPNGWEGGYVEGHSGVRDYWTRQWKAIDPSVRPVYVTEREDGRIAVDVHQVIHDMQGNLLFDGTVIHIFTIVNEKIKRMEIVKQ